MEVFAIPVEGSFIVYRPLRQLAFAANRAMADLALSMAHDSGTTTAPDSGSPSPSLPGDVRAYLSAVGFLEPDPPPPPPPQPSYKPTTAVLLLTHRCNLRCTYCYASGGQGPVRQLSPQMARAVTEQAYRNAVELGTSRFELTFHGGGEPLQAWETVQEATAYARSRDLPCHVSMVSNGVCTARQREWLLHNLDSFSISFDGRQETQDRQRPLASGRGSSKAVMQTIRAFDKAKFHYGIRMTATAPWRGQLAEDVRFVCEETGCSAVQVEPAFNNVRGQHTGPTQEQSEAFVEAFLEAFEVANRAGRRLVYSGARPWLRVHTFCSAPRGALIVNPAGQLVTCFEVTDDTHPLSEMSITGHVVDGQVVVDGPAHSALLARLASRRAACRDCFCYWHCAGDCYSRGITASAGNPHGSSPRCHMNREITAHLLLWYIMEGDGVWQGQGRHPQAAQLKAC